MENKLLRSYPNVLDIPQAVKDTLSDIQDLFPDAFLAGGILRDAWLGGVFKDADIWIPSTKLLVDSDISTLLFKSYSGFLNPVTQSSGQLYDAMNEQGRRILGICKSETNTGFPVDIIFYEDVDAGKPIEFIKSFDINICQIAMQDPSHVVYTSEFLQGVLTKTIKVCNENRTNRNSVRVQKLLTKYPEFTEDTTDYDPQF